VSERIGVQHGVTLTGENESTRTNTCHSSTLSANSPAQIGLRSNSVLRGEMPVNNCMRNGMIWVWFVLYCVGFI